MKDNSSARRGTRHQCRRRPPLAQQEAKTTSWFAIRLSPREFAIFDAFPDQEGRQAHLSGPIAKALLEKAPELLSEPPRIDNVDVLAAKLH